jgi:hypothetical protein
VVPWRAKNNGEDVRIFTKRVGSNFFLRDRQVAVEYKRPFSRLRMKAGIRCFEHSADDIAQSVDLFGKIRTDFEVGP